jgi:PelA/Pel-15E family pectate lyase
MAGVLNASEKATLASQKGFNDTTIDNGATHSQVIFLAKVGTATQDKQYQTAALKGLDFLLKAQYHNGGWPQDFPNPEGYHAHITFNDGAMIGVLNILFDIVQKRPDYTFVDEARRHAAEKAVQRGIECILNTQIVIKGKRAVWCAQHDEHTLEAAPARTYEKVSLSGQESVGIVSFLMRLEKPDSRIIESIESAIAWFKEVRLTGIRLIEQADPSKPRGYDKVVVKDTAAGPLWARFYERDTNRPIFSGRDGIIKHSLSEIEYERRVGYAWYTSAPAALIENTYPQWQARRSQK